MFAFVLHIGGGGIALLAGIVAVFALSLIHIYHALVAG